MEAWEIVLCNQQRPRGDESTDADWEPLLAKLKRWVSQKPDSITARVALADAYMNYAWKARGTEYGDRVAEEGWRQFEERVKLAETTLGEAKVLNGKCPEWYSAMLTVAQAEGWSKQETLALFQRAIAFEPAYDYYYREYALYLLPQWYGEEGEAQEFAKTISAQIGGKLGSIIYFEIARELRCDCVAQMSWTKIQEGYATIEELYGTSNERINQLAYLATRMQDADVAERMFARIGENWDKGTWNSKRYFDQCKMWASELAAYSRITKQVQSKVDANLQTPAGRQYDAQIAKEFPNKFTEVMKQCVASAGGDLGGSDLFLQLGSAGSVRQWLLDPSTTVGECLLSSLRSSSFTPPPSPDYWVKVSMNIGQ